MMEILQSSVVQINSFIEKLISSSNGGLTTLSFFFLFWPRVLCFFYMVVLSLFPI